ncbi:MAG: GIY-YIG nuclease family protein [Oscillibacter sp.]|jgi:putative endonuclease|nr:GIY-YIG nuclease family protein [Oscillibacter sp.]
MSEGPAERRWTVYILRCGDGTLYTGCTNDLHRRLEAHRRGRGAKYTRSRLPVELVYQEAAADKSAALRREMAVKALTRTQKLALIEKRREETAHGDPSAEGDRQPAGDQPHL